MRKIVLSMQLSLDGFFAGPNGELDWHMVDDELHTYFNQELAKMSMFLDGRVSYELMAEFWPTADEDPESSPPMVEFARIWRDMPKIVFSRTITEAAWNAVVLPDVVPDDIVELKSRPGGDMALGGAVLAETFRRWDLIDEYHLYIHPVVLGAGRPLFGPSDVRKSLELADTRTFGNGVVLLRYRR